MELQAFLMFIKSYQMQSQSSIEISKIWPAIYLKVDKLFIFKNSTKLSLFFQTIITLINLVYKLKLMTLKKPQTLIRVKVSLSLSKWPLK